MNDYNFGNFVCRLREEKGLTQADVAKALGVTPAAVSKWETGGSKPRVEVLFALAEILEVKPEELMAGKRLIEETLDPDVIKQINEKYEYLRRIELHSMTSVKIKRIFAFLTDWNIIGFFVMFLLIIAVALLGNEASPQMIGWMFVIMLLFPVLVALRDLIFGGRSIGKRIFGLVILDKQTAKKPKAWQLFVRDLFYFTMQFDVIVMLVTGRSIGDYAANTVVVPKKQLGEIKNDNSEQSKIQRINSYPEKAPKKASSKKTVIIVIASIVGAIALILSIVLLSLESVKNNEEYSVAYEYLVSSEAYENIGGDEKRVFMNSYSKSTDISGENGEAAFSFYVGLKRFTVVCHRENGENWYVCTECTKFK